MEKRSIYLTVKGRVQGVGFRYFTQRQAERLGIDGYVRNLKDGRVEVWASGPKDRLNELVASLKKGPPGARVDICEWRWDPLDVMVEGFNVRY